MLGVACPVRGRGPAVSESERERGGRDLDNVWLYLRGSLLVGDGPSVPVDRMA